MKKLLPILTIISLGALAGWCAVVDYGAVDTSDTHPTVDGSIGAGEYDLSVAVQNTGFGGLFTHFYADSDGENLYFGVKYSSSFVDNNAIVIYLDSDAEKNQSSVYAGARYLSDVTDNSNFTEMSAAFQGNKDGDQNNDPGWGTGPNSYVFDADFAFVVDGYAGNISGTATGDAGDGNQMACYGFDVADLSDLDWISFTYANSDGNGVAEFSIAISTMTNYAPASLTGILSTNPGNYEVYFSALLLNADNAWLSNESVPAAHTSQGNGYIDVVNVGSFNWTVNGPGDGAVPEPHTATLAITFGLVLVGIRRHLRRKA